MESTAALGETSYQRNVGEIRLMQERFSHRKEKGIFIDLLTNISNARYKTTLSGLRL